MVENESLANQGGSGWFRFGRRWLWGSRGGSPGLTPSFPFELETQVLSSASSVLGQETGGGVLASARRLADYDTRRKNVGATGGAAHTAEWQEEAWTMLDLIGEQRFLANTIAQRMGQASLYVGEMSHEDSPGSRPEKTKDQRLTELLASIGDGIAGQAQLITRFGVNMFVAGEAWLIGIPPKLILGSEEWERARGFERGESQGVVDRVADILDTNDADDVLALVWRMLSVSEVSLDQSGRVTLRLEGGEYVKALPEDLYTIRIWRPHPRRAWEADSPTRASLPVLRELLALTQHIGAQIDSRLAGAGVLAIPSEADEDLKRKAGIEVDDNRSPFTEALVMAMETSIGDRASASAIVPLIVTLPGETIAQMRYMSFATPLDEEARPLRDEAIRRLALGQDAPPELLLGTSGMNHWGAWLVREDVVTTHLEPPLTLLCDALTTQFLRPLMLELGFTDDETKQFVIWYDVDHLIARPNLTQDAKDAYAVGAISERSLREALGFEESDSVENPLSPAVELVISMLKQSPGLASSPGIPVLLEQLTAMLEGKSPEALPVGEVATEVSGEAGDGSVGLPDTAGDEPPVGTPGNLDGGM